MAGILAGKVKIYLNDELIEMKSFKDYVDLYIKDD